MIVTEKEMSKSSNPLIASGDRQEKDVAFFLKRAFKDEKGIFIFNDYRFSFDGENAQIDHLILYPFGFLIVESKSITGQVKVNSFGEWSRSYKDNWRGMASPIEQMELQRELLNKMLTSHGNELLPNFSKSVTQGFGGRSWDCLCAISSNAIIERNEIPGKINNLLVKSEFLVEKIKEIMKLDKGLLSLKWLVDKRVRFSEFELNQVKNGLIAYQRGTKATSVVKAIETPIEPAAINQCKSNNGHHIHCKYCDNTVSLVPSSGRYGYYVTCDKCTKRTPIKGNCFHCGSAKTKTSKKGVEFNLVCEMCSNKTPILGLNLVSH